MVGQLLRPKKDDMFGTSNIYRTQVPHLIQAHLEQIQHSIGEDKYYNNLQPFIVVYRFRRISWFLEIYTPPRTIVDLPRTLVDLE